jgi:hypothetical protein
MHACATRLNSTNPTSSASLSVNVAANAFEKRGSGASHAEKYSITEKYTL